MSGLIGYLLASKEVLTIMCEDPGLGACVLGTFVAEHDTNALWQARAYDEWLKDSVLERSPETWRAFVAWRLKRCDHPLEPVRLRWLGHALGLSPVTHAHGSINDGGVTVDDVAPEHLEGALGELARDRRVFGLAKYSTALGVGSPRALDGLRQEIGDCANYALGAELHRTHPETFKRLKTVLGEVLEVLDDGNGR